MATQKVQQIRGLRNKLREEARALQNRLEGIEMALAVLEGTEGQAPSVRIRKRLTNKAIVLSALETAAEKGLTVNEILAQRDGLKRGTISSQLSNWKAEGIVKHVDGRYYLPEFAPPRSDDDRQGQPAADAPAAEPLELVAKGGER